MAGVHLGTTTGERPSSGAALCLSAGAFEHCNASPRPDLAAPGTGALRHGFSWWWQCQDPPSATVQNYSFIYLASASRISWRNCAVPMSSSTPLDQKSQPLDSVGQLAAASARVSG